jgi:hypothetical protein
MVVVEPFGLPARQRQDLLGTWSKIKITYRCVSDARVRRLI